MKIPKNNSSNTEGILVFPASRSNRYEKITSPLKMMRVVYVVKVESAVSQGLFTSKNKNLLSYLTGKWHKCSGKYYLTPCCLILQNHETAFHVS